MAFTRHGHYIPTTPFPESDKDLPELVARCGEAGFCYACKEDVVRWKREQGMLDILTEHIPHELFQYFDFKHLPETLQTVSRPFKKLAEDLDYQLEDGSQKDLALTHLLQAKDAAVRAHITWLNREGRIT